MFVLVVKVWVLVGVVLSLFVVDRFRLGKLWVIRLGSDWLFDMVCLYNVLILVCVLGCGM